MPVAVPLSELFGKPLAMAPKCSTAGLTVALSRHHRRITDTLESPTQVIDSRLGAASK